MSVHYPLSEETLLKQKQIQSITTHSIIHQNLKF